jgi:hypothetical protein
MPGARSAGIAAALLAAAALAWGTAGAGEAPAPVRPAEWDTLYSGLPEEARLKPLIDFRYNRVDGPAPFAGIAVVADEEEDPVLYGRIGYAFSRERGLFAFGFEERIGRRPVLAFGGDVYRETANEDAWITGDVENTIFALVAGTDYRDHYEAEGGRAHVTWNPGRDFSLRVEARAEEHRSLTTRTDFSFFGDDDVFRPNPPAERGNDRAYVLAARVGPAKLPAAGGTQVGVSWERSGDPLVSDFDYGRLHASVRSAARLGPRLQLRVRAIGGSTLEGALPSQKVWRLGGIGTLRGHDYKVYSGDQFLLANAEPYVRLRKRNIYGFAFLDWGTAYFGSGNLDRQKPALDGGFGIRLGEGPVAIHVAKNLRDSGTPVLVGVRLGGRF